MPSPAQGRDLGRHRPVHRADRLRRRRLRAAHPRRRQHDRPGPARRDGHGLAAGRCWSSRRPAARDRPVGAQGRGRDPDLDPRHHRARLRRRGDRRPQGLERSTTPEVAGQASSTPRLRHPRRVQPASARSRTPASSPRCCSIFTLLLADFFDTMGTMTAIGAEAGLLAGGRHPPNTQRILVVDSLAAAAGGAAGVSSNTSYIESASGVGEGPAPASPRSSPGCCSCWRSSSPRWSRRSRPRRPSRPWSWSAS